MFKDAYWFRLLKGFHLQKSKNFAINEFVNEWERTLKKYAEYHRNKVLIIMQQIKHGN